MGTAVQIRNIGEPFLGKKNSANLELMVVAYALGCGGVVGNLITILIHLFFFFCFHCCSQSVDIGFVQDHTGSHKTKPKQTFRTGRQISKTEHIGRSVVVRKLVSPLKR